MPGLVGVGLVKATPTLYDLEGNWKLFELLVCSVGPSAGVQLFCSPEAFLDGYIVRDEGCTAEAVREVAQDVECSPYIERLRALARRVDAHLVFGFTQRIGAESFNAAVLVDPRGEIVGTYHKTHLQTHERMYSPGQHVPVFQTSLGGLGIMICADRRWPEIARALRVGGADLILTPSYGMWDDTNESLMRARSFENDVHACFVHPNVAHVTDPHGQVVARLQSNRPGVLVHDIDLRLVPESRHLAERRRDLYPTPL